ncbi:MAG TPA: hypothetical protein VKQ31_03410 [Steroidobacteraceae bacterium]|nr:hypothetical protein [Steroidobacteraceae bacterium]
MTRAPRALLAPLALVLLCGCAHQQTPRAAPAPPPPSAAAVPPAPAASPPAAVPGTPGAAVGAGSAPAGAPTRTAPAPPPAPASAAAPGAAPSAAAVAAAPAAAATLNLTSLEQRLRDTRAIGLFTKLSLKNQVDDLLAQFRAYYAGQGGVTLAELRRSYELLLMRVVTLLQDDDPGLASAVASSRDAIWAILSHRTSFSKLWYDRSRS